MGVTILAPSSATFPAAVAAPIVEIKQTWGDDWEYAPDLEFVRASRDAGANDLGACELRRRYGSVKDTYESGFSTRSTVNLMGYWVRVSLIGEQGKQVSWTGRIEGEPRQLHGSTTPSGVQHFVAYEPMQLLRKVDLSRSVWLVDGVEKVLGWTPDFNARDHRGLLVGNRSSAKSNGCHLFGGTDLWTHYDAAEYILNRFASEDGIVGPKWRLGGQADILKRITSTISISEAKSVADVMRLLVPPGMGVDYHTAPAADSGFDVVVHALVAEDVSFNGVSLPRNPNTVRLKRSQALDAVQVNIIRTRENQYGRIRVQGRRIVVCCTLLGSDGSLVPQWSDALETAYKAGTGTPDDGPADHDEVRKIDRFRPVYQQWGAPPAWDHQHGRAAIKLYENGAVADSADYQNSVRRTLTWLPIREGHDYTANLTGPPADGNLAGHEADMLSPAVWLYDEEEQRYVPAEKADPAVNVSVSHTDLGVMLSASPNHVLALNRFEGAADSDTEPVYDGAKAIATIAFESDHRLELEWEQFPAAQPSSGTLVIEDPHAEFWYLALDAVIGLGADGTFKVAGPLVLRDDTPRLSLLMAGAIARYHKERARAEITIKGLVPWGDLLGQVLTVIDDGGDSQTIQGVITSVDWTGGEHPMTVVRTGFAT